jgi:polyferredoxin
MEMQEQPEITLVAARISTEFPAQSKVAAKLKKKLVRRNDRDYSQITRRGFQIAFLLLNVWIGTLFYFWVRQFEPGGRPTSFDRPAGVEGWLPIAGLMNLRYFVLSHRVPDLHPAGMFLFVTFLSISFVFRKAFCSWLCPVGTISEYLWRAGRKLFRRNFHLPRWGDVALRSLKYLLLGFFVWAVNSMGADELAAFMRSPYGVIADVKMLNFFRHMGETAAIVLVVLVIASVFIQNFWCRYLCPYGALLGLVSLLSPARIRRNAEGCIDCAKCAKACPSALPVDKLVTIRSAECTGCFECVAVCPANETLNLALPKIADRRAHNIPVWAVAAGIALLFVGIVGFAKTTGHWNSQVPGAVYQQLVPNADQALHPMPGENQ